MAKASLGVAEREETIRIVEPMVVLTLSQDEAETIAAMVGHVVGSDYQKSPRKHSYNVLKALMSVNIDGFKVKRLIKSPCTEFRDYPE